MTDRIVLSPVASNSRWMSCDLFLYYILLTARAYIYHFDFVNKVTNRQHNMSKLSHWLCHATHSSERDCVNTSCTEFVIIGFMWQSLKASIAHYSCININISADTRVWASFGQRIPQRQKWMQARRSIEYI